MTKATSADCGVEGNGQRLSRSIIKPMGRTEEEAQSVRVTIASKRPPSPESTVSATKASPAVYGWVCGHPGISRASARRHYFCFFQTKSQLSRRSTKLL